MVRTPSQALLKTGPSVITMLLLPIWVIGTSRIGLAE